MLFCAQVCCSRVCAYRHVNREKRCLQLWSASYGGAYRTSSCRFQEAFQRGIKNSDVVGASFFCWPLGTQWCIIHTFGGTYTLLLLLFPKLIHKYSTRFGIIIGFNLIYDKLAQLDYSHIQPIFASSYLFIYCRSIWWYG